MPRRSNPLPPPDRRFTHVDTGYHAGTYHRLPYYTLEYIEYINKRDNHHPSTESDFALDVPVVGFNNKRRMKPRICANESCQREFIPVGARHRSCSPRCAKIVEKKRKEGWWDSNRDAQNTRRRVETRTHAGRVAASIMLDRETDIRRKGIRKHDVILPDADLDRTRRDRRDLAVDIHTGDRVVVHRTRDAKG